MTPVHVLIFHPEAPPDAGPLTRLVADARRATAERHRSGFVRIGAATVDIVAGPPDRLPFGARLRRTMAGLPDGGLVVLGSGAVPLLRPTDRRRFVDAASVSARRALANNRFSADIVAIGGGRPERDRLLRDLPDALTDNGLPRWLEERQGFVVEDLHRRWRLGIDIDGPLDLLLLGRPWSGAISPADGRIVAERLAAVRRIAADPRAELLVSGRTSLESLRWLHGTSAARTRALIEERGLRTRVVGQRPAASVLGALLDDAGPGALGTIVGRLGDAAVIDTRVLLAHRLGAAEDAWPSAEDRFAADLLLADRIADPWLRALTEAALEAPIPVVLGGHTLVGPGLRLAFDPARAVDPWTG